MLLARDVFGQSGRCDIRQPVEDYLAPDTGDLTVSIEVRLRDFIGMKFQYQVGTADIRGGITATGIRPIDHDGLRRLAQNVSGVKIAVAQVIAIGHLPNNSEPELIAGDALRRSNRPEPARAVEINHAFGPRDVDVERAALRQQGEREFNRPPVGNRRRQCRDECRPSKRSAGPS